MAHDEMLDISAPDVERLTKSRDKIWMYWASEDSWVGSQREHVLSLVEFDPDKTIIAPGIPHAFCISECVDHRLRTSEPSQRIVHRFPNNVLIGYVPVEVRGPKVAKLRDNKWCRLVINND
jgi:hypothetical protein